MNTQSIALLSALGILASAALPAAAQDALDRDGPAVVGRDGTLTVRPVVRSANRASRIVGLRVRNYQNQDLGRVDDVVFDFKTGRVAYVVMAVPTADGMDRLVAVPPRALAPAGDGSDQLVLNIDRTRLENAPSFAKSNWPDFDHPFKGAETFWAPILDVNERNRIYSSSEPDLDRDHIVTYDHPPVETYQGVSPQYESSTATIVRPPPVIRSSFRGRVVAVNPETRTMSVESNTGEIRDFVFSDRPNLQLKNTRNPRIVDLKVGFPIIVGYRQDPDGTLTAQTVIRTDTPEVK